MLNYMSGKGLPLAGASMISPVLRRGKNYMMFPIRKL